MCRTVGEECVKFETMREDNILLSIKQVGAWQAGIVFVKEIVIGEFGDEEGRIELLLRDRKRGE